MEEKEAIENLEIPVEVDEATKISEKRNKMCNEILKIEKNNINKTNKESDAEMARKIYGIVWRNS